LDSEKKANPPQGAGYPKMFPAKPPKFTNYNRGGGSIEGPKKDKAKLAEGSLMCFGFEGKPPEGNVESLTSDHQTSRYATQRSCRMGKGRDGLVFSSGKPPSARILSWSRVIVKQPKSPEKQAIPKGVKNRSPDVLHRKLIGPKALI